MGFLQQFHLVIKYKKGTSNKVADMLSRPPISASIVLKNDSLSHDIYVEQYDADGDCKDVYEMLTHNAWRTIIYKESYFAILASFVFLEVKESM